MDALNSMLAEQNVDYSLRMKLREYLREQQYHDLLLRSRQISQNFSKELQEALIPETLIGTALRKVSYFKAADAAFLVDVAHTLECLQHGPKEKVGGLGLLCIVQRGSAVRHSRILLPGDFWGADMILVSKWLADPTQAIALNFIEVLSLRKEALDKVLCNHPVMKAIIRKAAVSIAFCNAIRMIAKEQMQEKQGEKERLSIKGARITGIFNSLGQDCRTSEKRVTLMGLLDTAPLDSDKPSSVQDAGANPSTLPSLGVGNDLTLAPALSSRLYNI
jgi:hypothetical protein